ncbi:ribosomal biogenesis protein LAS1L isoform X1 [Polypterus senegalus]|uniref:ribosomal biogenesis protein LAS1L isoform X1 n=2 Tax=Polypterus senegalus TaxID=55291 RepID=UPI001964D7CE|nr:ribosomal biogenesis protein LAS1L isoform X1 [Polypterus senegalus]
MVGVPVYPGNLSVFLSTNRVKMMRKLLSPAAFHVVAWINKAEWDQVLEYLYCQDCNLQKYALERISAWKGRYGSSTPIAVESTADLVRCQVIDSCEQVAPEELVLLYGMALVRFVNLITEPKQKMMTIPLRRLAREMNIPEWIVNLRHQLTHGRLPTLNWCRKGCEFVLDWLRKEYWSRQLGSIPSEYCELGSDEAEVKEEEMAEANEEENKEKYVRAQELLVSYERERFQVLEEQQKTKKTKNNGASTELEWTMMQIKHFAAEDRSIMIDVLLSDGFLIPTTEQLDSLDIEPLENELGEVPSIPSTFLRFWQPLFRLLQSRVFVSMLLQKLFCELQQCCEVTEIRTQYIVGWINEIITCIQKTEYTPKGTCRGQKDTTSKRDIITCRFRLDWWQLLRMCLAAPCPATPVLLQLILAEIKDPLPLDTKQKLIHLCSIYTQTGDSGMCSPSDSDDQEDCIYTLESLQRSMKQELPHADDNLEVEQSDQESWFSSTQPQATISERLTPEVVAERMSALKGSPWQICTDSVKWEEYPLGKIPGQSDDPSCLMVDSYSTMSVMDQSVDLGRIASHSTGTGNSVQKSATPDGLRWTQSDLHRLKSSLQLF